MGDTSITAKKAVPPPKAQAKPKKPESENTIHPVLAAKRTLLKAYQDSGCLITPINLNEQNTPIFRIQCEGNPDQYIDASYPREEANDKPIFGSLKEGSSIQI